MGAEERRERRGWGGGFGASGSRGRERVAGSRLWGWGSLMRRRWGGGVLVERLLFKKGGGVWF